jgi:tetratricopeptide (TPR) repeat protein
MTSNGRATARSAGASEHMSAIVRSLECTHRNVAFWLVALATVACQARPPVTPTSAAPVTTTPIVITPLEGPADEFERARQLLLAGKAREAAPLFDELARDPSPDIAPFASFNAGIAWEEIGDSAAALARFRAVLAHHPDGDLGKWAAVRTARLHVARVEWSPLSAMADWLLDRADLDDVERLESYGAKALSVVECGDADGAERYVAKGRDIVETLHLGDGGKLPLEVAQLYFALGEVRRLHSEAIVFVPLPDHFADALERRCQGLLDAQGAYTDAMRGYDPHWAAMSGYRVGQLYQRLYKDVMAIPVPKMADTTEKKQLFEGAMRLRYRVLLEKGLTMMEHTLLLGVRTDDESAWMDRARAAKRELDESLREQKELIAKLPYSERQLQTAFDDLAKLHP